MAERRARGLAGLQQAFDDARFGGARTLNLRATLPTASEASQRLENWLRQHQMLRSTEVLVITGRGNNSDNGVSVVREASIRVLREMRRKNVIRDFSEHTPGSFVATLAPISALLDATKRRRELTPVPPSATPPTLRELESETRDLLRALAKRSLDALGVRDGTAYVEDEMLRLFGALAATVLPGPNREERLRAAISAAMDDSD